MEGPAERTPNATQGRTLVLFAALLWSAGGLVAKLLLATNLSPSNIAFYRSLFAGLSLLPFIRASHWVVRPVMVPCTLVFGAMIALYLGAIQATTAANAILLQCTSTFWVVPLSALILRERPDARSIAGIGLTSVGIIGIVLYGYVGKPGEWHGIVFGLGSGICYAIVFIALRGLRELDSLWLSAFNNLGGALALGAGMLLWSGRIALPTPSQALVLFAFGAFQMAIPYAIFARGLREIGAPEAGLISLLEPILNPIWVVLVYHERPAPATVVGGAFLLAGVLLRFWPTPLPFERKDRRSEANVPSP